MYLASDSHLESRYGMCKSWFLMRKIDECEASNMIASQLNSPSHWLTKWKREMLKLWNRSTVDKTCDLFWTHA